MKRQCITIFLLWGLHIAAYAQWQAAPEPTVTLSINGNAIQAEVADSPAERERGLMQRKHLCSSCGMLFVFDRPSRLIFWMKNTPLPLSIAFIDAQGRIINMEEMQPETETYHYAAGEALYALEMNASWFAQHQIKTGDRVYGLNLPDGN